MAGTTGHVNGNRMAELNRRDALNWKSGDVLPHTRDRQLGRNRKQKRGTVEIRGAAGACS